MNVLLFALEDEGLQISVKEQSTSVVAFGQTILFGIEEDLQIKEKQEEPSYSGTKTVNVYERSGRIAFRVWSHATGHRARWGDGKPSPFRAVMKTDARALTQGAEGEPQLFEPPGADPHAG